MNKYVLKIDGMKCNMCESHINDLVRRNLNIKSVKSSHKKNETIIISENEIEYNSFYELFENSGYKLEKITKEEAKKILFLYR